jgi:cellulose synthase (UDP-forming)
MLADPANIQKYLYIEKTPTWKVRSLHLFGLFSWLLIGYGYLLIIGVDFYLTYIVFPIIGFLVVYHLLTLGLNLFYKQFDLKQHLKRIEEYWINKEQPSVDIFLPICGEKISILQNTWKHVSNLNYRNKTVYVLDDSNEEYKNNKKLAQSYGFNYLERPNKREMKKAGNLKYGFERSQGEIIAIFDADFAPHKDFLIETLPYMNNPKVGIVQTPQYYDMSQDSYKHSAVAYNEAYAEEPFYRFIQVARNHFKGALCCGSNAIYRRTALAEIGGPYQIEHSEDAHTGYALTIIGYRVLYIPIILAIGLCPDNYYSFFHQQHRWCMGSMSLMLTKRFWFAPISWKQKLCYISGFMFYLHHPLTIILSFHLFWVLFLYNDFIHGGNFIYYPQIIFTILYVWLFPIAKLRIGYLELLIARTYAYSHAVLTAFLGKSVGWISTNVKHTSISPAFLQTITLVSTYVCMYLLFVLIGLRTGDIHLFNYRYWSIQFWIFYNFLLSIIILRKLLSTAKQIATR